MQPLTAAPRAQLSAAQVTSLLQSPAIEISAGLELLDAELKFVADISDDLAGGSIRRNCHSKIHGTARLSIKRALTWGVDLVRPYMVLTDGTVEARWNVGTFVMTTPERAIGETPETYEVQGYDRLMLLDRQVGDTYEVAAGTTYRQALLDIFTAAGVTGSQIDGSAADDVLPVAMVWPLVGADRAQSTAPATWLRIINDVLSAINFRAVWADENGIFRCQAYQDPATRAVEFTFDADSSLTIVGEERRVIEDVWATPNRWVFRATNRDPADPVPTEGDGLYTVNNVSDGPTSQDSRGLVWTAVIDYEAASQAALVALGDRRVAADRRVTTRFSVTTGPFPGAGHWDIFEFTDEAAGGTRKVQSISWSMPLDGGDVSHEWEAV